MLSSSGKVCMLQCGFFKGPKTTMLIACCIERLIYLQSCNVKLVCTYKLSGKAWVSVFIDLNLACHMRCLGFAHTDRSNISQNTHMQWLCFYLRAAPCAFFRNLKRAVSKVGGCYKCRSVVSIFSCRYVNVLLVSDTNSWKKLYWAHLLHS
jgi:hypothetical protein